MTITRKQLPPPPLLSELAQFSRESRAYCGASIDDVCSKASIARNTLWRIEHCRGDPSMETARKVINALNRMVRTERNRRRLIVAKADRATRRVRALLDQLARP